MTFADDIVTLLSSGSWTSPAEPDPIYAVYDNESSIKYYIDKRISALEVRHATAQHDHVTDKYENLLVEIPCALSATDEDNLESVMNKLGGIVNKYSNNPIALNGTTYTWSQIITDENTSSLRKKGIWVMNFSVFLGIQAKAKTIEA